MTFKKSLIVAIITVFLDFLFHFFLTHPIESMTYFVIKFLLAFFAAAGMFNSYVYIKKKYKRKFVIPITALVFSTLMSVYYRAWELEAQIPFGSRAPDIVGIYRESVLFGLAWWLAHAAFFIVGVIVAEKVVKK